MDTDVAPSSARHVGYGHQTHRPLVCLAFIAPLFNNWVQSMLTEALNDSPKVTNSVVSSNWWKVLNFILRSTTSMKLPSEASMLILQARKSGDTQILTK